MGGGGDPPPCQLKSDNFGCRKILSFVKNGPRNMKQWRRRRWRQTFSDDLEEGRGLDPGKGRDPLLKRNFFFQCVLGNRLTMHLEKGQSPQTHTMRHVSAHVLAPRGAHKKKRSLVCD